MPVGPMLLLALALGGCEEKAPSRQPAESELPREAETLLEADGRWLEAAELYRRRALAASPPSNGSSIRQALNAFYMAERPDEAEKFADEVRSRWPDFHDVLLFVADLQRVTMRHEEARRTIEAFLAKQPDHAQGNLVSGLILVALGETGSGLGAIEAFLRHAGVDPAHRREAEVVRVRALRGLGRFQDAADAITEVLEDRPLDPVALADAAQTYAIARNELLARAASEEHAWLSRRGHRLTVQDPTALHRTGPSPEGQARLALQARDRREFLSAIDQLRALLAKEPGNSKLAYLLGQLWLRLSRFRECRQVLEALEESRVASDPDLLHVRALLLVREGRSRDAVAEWRRAVQAIQSREAAGSDSRPVEQPEAVLLAAADHLVEADGDLELADQWYAAASNRSPGSDRPLVGRLRVALRRGQLDRARELRDDLKARVDPETSDDYRRLDATLRGLSGDLRFAARELTQMIVKDPTEDQNFSAFLRVFGDQREVPEVAQVRQLRDEWSAKRRALEEGAMRLSRKPFEECATEYHRLGLLSMELRDREGALDAFMTAAELDRDSTDSLKEALKVLRQPGDIFVRLHCMRRILERDPRDLAILELLVRTYVRLSVRRGEAVRLAARVQQLRPDAASEKLLQEASGR